MTMHRDTKQDYEHFLRNLKIEPYDIHAEYRLGRVLMCGSITDVSKVIDKLAADDFYDLAMQIIYNTAAEDMEKGGSKEGFERFCHMTTAYFDRLNGKNMHININNNDNIAAMMDFSKADDVPDAAEIDVCIEQVKKRRHLRDLINGLYTAVDMCTHEDNGVEKTYDFLRDAVFNHDADMVSDENISKLDFANEMMGLVHVYNDPEERQKKTINMPWPIFQKVVGGFGAEELVIVSAKSGQGKSVFALNVAIEVGVTQKIPTLYINSELSNEQMASRYLSYTCYIDSRKIREGEYRDESTDVKVNSRVLDAINVASEGYYKSELLFKHIPDLQLSNIERVIRQDCVERGTKLVIVDYIGRMDITKSAGVRDLQEWQIMRLAANRLKSLAQKYHVCIIMVAQLTDEGTLQGSKAMKNEADMWLSINRLKEPDDVFMHKRLIDISPYNTFVKIEKARNVSDFAAVKFRFEGAMMRFCDTDESIVKMIERNGLYGKYANTLISAEDYNLLKNRIKYRETNKGAR